MVDVGIRQLFELGVIVDYDVRVGDCILVEATRRIRGGWRFFVVSRVCESKVGLASEFMQSFSSARSGSRVEFFFEIWHVVDDDVIALWDFRVEHEPCIYQLRLGNEVVDWSHSVPSREYVIQLWDGDTLYGVFCSSDVSWIGYRLREFYADGFRFLCFSRYSLDDSDFKLFSDGDICPASVELFKTVLFK